MRIGSKRKRAEASKLPRKQISNVTESRQPQKSKDSDSFRDQRTKESSVGERPLSINPRKARDVAKGLSNSVAHEQREIGDKVQVDETCEKDLNTRKDSFWTREEVFDQSDDDQFLRDCLETWPLPSNNQEDGCQKYPELEALWLPLQQGLTDNSKGVVSSRKDGRSYNPFSENFFGDPLDLQKCEAKSFENDYPCGIHISDFPRSNNGSLPWGDDDDYPMNESDALGVMQLAEAEKAIAVTKDTPTAQGLDAGETLQLFPTHNAHMIEPDVDHTWEIDDLFIKSLQEDLNDSEPKEDITGNESFAFSSPLLAPRSPSCSDNPDPVCLLALEISERPNGHRPESLYDDEELDRELLNLGTSAFGNANGSSPSTPPSSPVPVSPPKSPHLERPTPQPDIPHMISFDADGKALPFIRPPFAKPVRDRSVIHALRSQPVLRPCFRVGEALNVGCATVSSDTDAIIELYARVSSSTREPGSYKQRFRFADLFTADKPPFLAGVYALWRGVELWDHGSRVFLGEAGKGRMARVLGRIRKEEGEWVMAILCIWQVDWEEVSLAKGIVCS